MVNIQDSLHRMFLEMLNKVKALIEKYNLFEDFEDVSVALSGGADSVCLLYVLCELREEFSLNITAIHVNHMLRGDESDRDQEFVKKLCERLSIPLTICSADVKDYAQKNGESIELAARNLRYELFKQHSKGLVATAHNAGDNLETVILNITRGTGLKGLGGIPVKRDVFIRPLLSCTRDEIEGFLKERGETFVIDSTNLEDNYSRNRIRHRVVPSLKELNGVVETTAFNMTENIKEDIDLIESITNKTYLLCSRSNGLDAELLKANHKAIIKRVLAYYFKENFGYSPERLHIERMNEVLHFGGKKSLKGNTFCKIDNKIFIVGTEGKTENEVFFDVKLKKTEKINNLFLKNTIDCDKIDGSLVVRKRVSGDKIKQSGRNCTKSLKKLYSEIKLNPKIRDFVPVIADNIGVVWAYGVGVDARVAVDKNTNNAVEIYVDTAD